MRLSRGGQKFSANIWPGYVDAVTTLLMVIMFALTIAMVVQAVLREQITEQDSQLGQLGNEIAQLSGALSDTQGRAQTLDRDLTAERERLAAERARLASEAALRVAAEQGLSAARDQIDAKDEAARLDAARREAMDMLVADLRRREAEASGSLAETTSALDQAKAQLSDAETARLADAAAAKLLEEKLSGSQAELTAMTMQLEEQRKKAEETLTLLAAAEAAKKDLAGRVDQQVSEADKNQGLLALAQQKLSEQQALSSEDQRRVALLNEQVAELNSKLGTLQAVLDAAGDTQKQAELRVEDLGQQLNAALLQVAEAQTKTAAEQSKNAELERQAREKAEAEAADLSRYRSEFFGRLSQILQGRQGVRVVGDRFVFSSEVLFPVGEATLSPAGREQIRQVAETLKQIAPEIPPEIDWIIRVDGHTDNLPLSGAGRYRDNWELSQARALAVVRYLIEDLGFPANRLAATGFGDTRPIAEGDSDEARAQNRRIELKLTER
ncbi:peptidoglycan -binding protein [Paracoccus aminophilus]|uniref:Flagellar motor protein n=1 Tax=Paracoccus aminophilus JCM 7686 TaxID=1367847 RepID=S5XXB9_PARAH|nr:peptidoglycan -binding protein [Paracoccus aminophilus]AGT08075.1 flagellar motor protein [Paracoccus aminophilus JCM 7686]